jgi:hypothetical protein
MLLEEVDEFMFAYSRSSQSQCTLCRLHDTTHARSTEKFAQALWQGIDLVTLSKLHRIYYSEIYNDKQEISCMPHTHSNVSRVIQKST